MNNARQVAYHCLQRIDHDGAYANLLLQSELGRSRLSDRDRGFVTELVYGTTRMRRGCDALIDRFLVKEPQPSLRTLLRLGAYQLHFAGVAAHAAVGETVELAPKAARGFVNAILRRVGDTPMEWPNDAVRMSYPDWIYGRLSSELGDEAEAAMMRMNEPAPVSVRADGYRAGPRVAMGRGRGRGCARRANTRPVRGARGQGDGDGGQRCVRGSG